MANHIKLIHHTYWLMFWGKGKDVREEIKKLREQSGLKIVNLPHVDNYHAMDDNLGDINLYDVDPF